MIIIVYWYLFSNHYTRECIHTCERERNVAPLNSPRALYWPPPRGVGMHLMLTTLPPHPAYRHFTGERGVTIEKMERVNGYVFITGGLMGGAGYEPL